MLSGRKFLELLSADFRYYIKCDMFPRNFDKKFVPRFKVEIHFLRTSSTNYNDWLQNALQNRGINW